MVVDWYIDYLSPFVHLQAEDFARQGWPLELRCKPVVFAGLLDHWGQLGPAEIPAKKRFIFRQSLWRAHQMGTPFKGPRLHPFHPIKLLRLSIAINATPQQALEISRFVWRDGHVAEEEADYRQLLERLGVSGVDERIASPEVKAQLHRNGEEAIARGVFGVPTLYADGELFWGADATDMCMAYLNRDPIFSSPDMRAFDSIAVGAQRKR
jgi:2-hydroxychromene-2-carboxylate isomerase